MFFFLIISTFFFAIIRDLQELYLSNNKLKGTKDLLVNYSETLEILDISYNNIEDFQELV